MPLFSIIIPTLNSAFVIRKALESILVQKFFDYEVLIIDGGSTDGTIEVISSYDDERVKIFSQCEKGIYDAMNMGISLASGKWLYFFGSDDQLADDYVFSDMFKLVQFDRINLIYGNVSIIGQVNWAKGEENYAGRFNLYRLLRRNICHQSIFYNRRFLLKNNLGYKTEFPISADWDLNIRCFLLTKPTHVNRTIAIFQGGGKSSRETDSFSESIKTIYHRYWTNPYQSQPKRFLYSLFSKLKSGLRGS
jgi:glycosyltransferase involved in cell wall biosynthesis